MTAKITDSLLWYIVFILSVTIHEAAHAWAAKRGGDLTAYAGGQVSLNPLPHMRREPLGMVVFPIISSLLIGWPFGFASTPYNLAWAHQNPRKASLMAAAGPAANLLLILLCVTIVKIGIASGILAEPYSVGLKHMVDTTFSGRLEGIPMFISMLFSLNLILLVLNIFPVPPFDGAGIISLFLKEDAARSFRKVITNPVFGLLGLILAWQVFTPIFNWVYPWVMNLIYWGAGYH
jgi:Zn-dependent protease